MQELQTDLPSDQDMQKVRALSERMKFSIPSEIGYVILSLFFVGIIIVYIKIYTPHLSNDSRCGRGRFTSGYS